MNKKKIKELPLNLNVWVCLNSKKDSCIILKKETNKQEIIKTVVYCALNNVPLVIQPIFNNRLNALNSLIEKGIIYREKDNLYFTE